MQAVVSLAYRRLLRRAQRGSPTLLRRELWIDRDPRAGPTAPRSPISALAIPDGSTYATHSMSRERLAYLLFLVVGTAQLGALAVIGDTRFSKGGIVLMVVLAAWLGRRSRVAWWLFVAGNVYLLLASAPLLAAGGQVNWANAVAITLGSVVLLAILSSRPMRRWVRPPADALNHAAVANNTR